MATVPLAQRKEFKKKLHRDKKHKYMRERLTKLDIIFFFISSKLKTPKYVEQKFICVRYSQ